MTSARYCALITLDSTGHPQVRTMDPFPPDENLVVWFGTNSNSRKVKEINTDSRVTVYYEAPDDAGYVVLRGNAFVVDDQKLKTSLWKDEWNDYYSDEKTNYMLIKVLPDRLEIVDYTRNIIGDSSTWAVPYVNLK